MQFFQLLALAMAGLAAAKGHDGNNKAAGNKTLSVHAQCNEMAKFQSLIALAGNATKLEKASHGNSTKASKIQAEASQAATSLKTMESNATLVTACDQQFAVQKMAHACGQMQELDSLNALVANSTRLSAASKGNSTKAANIEAKAKSLAAKLQTDQSNTTLTAFCAVEQTKAQCSTMSKMQKDISKASNETYLANKFKNNATKIASFKAKATKLQSKLAEMQSNTTLTDACSSLKTTTGNAASSSTSAKTGAAGMVQPMAGAVSLVSLFFAAILLL